MNTKTGLEQWHRVVEGGSPPGLLADLIAEEAVFHSPVVHTPLGKASGFSL